MGAAPICPKDASELYQRHQKKTGAEWVSLKRRDGKTQGRMGQAFVVPLVLPPSQGQSPWTRSL